MAKDTEKETKSDKKTTKTAAPKEPKTASKTKQAAAAPVAEGQEAASKPKKVASTGPKRNPMVPQTYFAEPGKYIGWRLVDATNVPLGRLSSHIALLLMGKDKAAFTRHEDAGDHVVVINATKVKLTGNKWADKVYNYHTNYPGGIKTFTAQQLLDKHPDWLIQWAVWGMLPKAKGHMARKWYKKLRVFPGGEHTHTAQQPVPVVLPNLGTHA